MQKGKLDSCDYDYEPKYVAFFCTMAPKVAAVATLEQAVGRRLTEQVVSSLAVFLARSLPEICLPECMGH